AEYKVGWERGEGIRSHESISRSAARQRVVELLGRVGIPSPGTRIDDYPHQFSGGMRQRALIAMALALNPKLLIADEPTTALDVTVQAQIVELMKELQAEFGTAIIAITHDLGVIADIADEVLVMYAGQAMERGDRRTLYRQPHHPYTKGLIEALPSETAATERLRPISGPSSQPHPAPGRMPVPPRLLVRARALQARGSALATRGRRGQARLGLLAPAGPCRPRRGHGKNGLVTASQPSHPRILDEGDVLVRVEDLAKRFPVPSDRLFGRVSEEVRAVAGVSLEARRGETLGLVGESGCGKSTLARCITRLYDLTAGQVIFDGDDISQLSRRRLRPYRLQMQMIFQDPYGSLNPRRRVG